MNNNLKLVVNNYNKKTEERYFFEKNELIWRTQTEEFWVNFKVWGILPITIIFTAFQLSIITKFKLND